MIYLKILIIGMLITVVMAFLGDKFGGSYAGENMMGGLAILIIGVAVTAVVEMAVLLCNLIGRL